MQGRIRRPDLDGRCIRCVTTFDQQTVTEEADRAVHRRVVAGWSRSLRKHGAGPLPIGSADDDIRQNRRRRPSVIRNELANGADERSRQQRDERHDESQSRVSKALHRLQSSRRPGEAASVRRAARAVVRLPEVDRAQVKRRS